MRGRSPSMTDPVLPGLVKRCASLAGELEASQAKMRQLDPAYPVDAIATKRPRSATGDVTGDMGGRCWTCCGARAGR